METKLYLAYSWDMHPEYMYQHLERNCKYVGKSFLNGYRLSFRGGSGKPTLEEVTGAVTPCVLWRINSKGEAILAAEFDDYERVELPVSYCGFDDMKALAFVMQPGKPLRAPEAETVMIMRGAYKLQDIPERLLDQAVLRSSV